MKIAQIAPIYERVPPKKYGGTERVVFSLTEELVNRGHQVTLFASADSSTSARLISVVPKGLREMKIKNLYGADAYTMHNIGLAYALQDEFDIIHDHNWHMALPAAQVAATPTLITLHGAFDTDSRQVFESLKRAHLVSISKSQARIAPNLNYVANIYHGISEIEKYPFSLKNKGYLLFVGRISKQKGVHLAIKTAQRLGMPLIIAAKLDVVDRPYFYEYVKPHLKGDIKWIGEVSEKERNDLMKNSFCFLHPVTWPEPFGLTIIESMACGAPVVAMNMGSIPELIQDGRTGYVVRNVDEMVGAVRNIGKISRKYCRQYALSNFNTLRMAKDYERVYEEVLEIEKNRQIFSSSKQAKKDYSLPKYFLQTRPAIRIDEI